MDFNGIKEIVALYLMIPYMTEQQLKTPGGNYIVPSLSGIFVDDITYANLRNTICHSFVTVEENKDESQHGKVLIFDDRINMNRNEHEEQGYHSKAVFISIDKVHQRMLEVIDKVRNYQES